MGVWCMDVWGMGVCICVEVYVAPLASLPLSSRGCYACSSQLASASGSTVCGVCVCECVCVCVNVERAMSVGKGWVCVEWDMRSGMCGEECAKRGRVVHMYVPSEHGSVSEWECASRR